MDTQDWMPGVPSIHGYYLAAWRRAGSLTVSELWFNPDAIHPWWFTRAYTGDRPGRDWMNKAVPSEVVAWMPMPNPPEKEVYETYERTISPDTSMDP